MKKRIGFISTRFSGTDGVSLESIKWAEVLEAAGHTCFWFAGESDRPDEVSFMVPQAHFQHPSIQHINERVFGTQKRNPGVTETIHQLRALIKNKLHQFIKQFQIELLVVQNALTIPMNVPLGLAITEVIAETQLPTIAHHHDFTWERDRFVTNSINDYLQMAFPPILPGIEHVVINSAAREQLAHRKGISSTVIPNVLDYEKAPVAKGDTSRFRSANGFTKEDIIILQPTRVIQRKGIEHAIEMVKQLGGGEYKLLVSHEAGDEGYEYADWLIGKAKEQGVDLRFMATPVSSPWQCAPVWSQFSLWDVYAAADFVTFPSLSEGFGNAFLEAIYFKKPLLVNRYSTFIRDIEPLGFDLLMMDGYINGELMEAVRQVITSSARLKKMTEHNYRVAAKYFSYQVLRNRLGVLMAELLREENASAGIHSTALPNNVVTLTEREVRPRRVAQAR